MHEKQDHVPKRESISQAFKKHRNKDCAAKAIFFFDVKNRVEGYGDN